MRGDKNVSVLKVTGINCQLTGNYTCVTENQFGSVQRQLTLSILGKQKRIKKGRLFATGLVFNSFFEGGQLAQLISDYKEEMLFQLFVVKMCGETLTY